MTLPKLTEDETVNLLASALKLKGWAIDSFCLGQTHGNDIVATKSKKTLVLEVKGARAGDKAPTKKREYFNGGQIKTHFGKALVKVLEEKYRNPGFQVAIAHPDDKDIRKSIGNLIPFLKTLGIKHFWVLQNGTVIEE